MNYRGYIRELIVVLTTILSYKTLQRLLKSNPSINIVYLALFLLI